MKIAIIQFPGSNCERETILAVKRAGMEAIEFLWNESHEKLKAMDGYIIVGGFSYEDRSRAGIIAALAPVMQVLKSESKKGKPILGICNGAQILVESGLVPGLENNKLALALTENKRIQNDKIIGTGYYNAWVYLKLAENYQRNAFTRHLNSQSILAVPIAHAEGRFVITNALLMEIQHQGLNVFQYCNQQGEVINQFPINPNGSVDNIAAISNKAGNVMAIMPHPERTSNGDAIFQSMRDYIQERSPLEPIIPLAYYPRKQALQAFKTDTRLLKIKLIITDNHALTVQSTLRQLGIEVNVQREVLWEVDCTSEEVFQAICQSGVLYNDRKEMLTSSEQTPNSSISLLIKPKEDLLAKESLQKLTDHFQIQGIKQIQHGILWHFSSKNVNIMDLKDKILTTNILYNPYAHDCFEYSTAVP